MGRTTALLGLKVHIMAGAFTSHLGGSTRRQRNDAPSFRRVKNSLILRRNQPADNGMMYRFFSGWVEKQPLHRSGK
ncbi:hypothetical protein C8R43DRAFT_681783 [Mycena crocata]|nr:hypothetical protein C8R43DRAFT_681783 [Mycena crocata]